MLLPGVVELREDGGRGGPRGRRRGWLARGRQVGVRPPVGGVAVGPEVAVRPRRRGRGMGGGAGGRGEAVAARGRRRGGGGRIVRGRAGRVTRVAGHQTWEEVETHVRAKNSKSI